MECRTSTHWMWSFLCRPASPSRKALTLPYDLSVDESSVNEYGDGETYAQTWRSNNWVPKPDCKDVSLVHPIVPSILEALKTDLGAWSFELTDEHAQWMAEHLFAFAYTKNKLDHDLIKSKHADACVIQTKFSEAYPELNVQVSAYSTNPNKSMDLWTVLRAFNAYRFEVIDSLEVAKSAELLDEMPEPSTSITELRALYACALRLREHTVIDVLMRLTPLVENNPRVSPMAVERLDNPMRVHAVPLYPAMYVTRVLLNFTVGVRNLARDQNFEGLYAMTRSFSTWASLRQGTLLALGAKAIDTSNFIDAVHRAEMAIMTEYWALIALIKYMKANNSPFSRQLIILNLVLASRENETRFMNDITPKVYQVFNVPRELLKTSNLMMLVCERLVDSNSFEDPLMQTCCLLTNPAALRKTYKLLKIVDPCVTKHLETATCESWNFFIDVSLKSIEEAMVKEDKLRIETALKGEGRSLNFPAMPYTLGLLREMRALE